MSEDVVESMLMDRSNVVPCGGTRSRSTEGPLPPTTYVKPRSLVSHCIVSRIHLSPIPSDDGILDGQNYQIGITSLQREHRVIR
jgi:hypothetical protein